MGMRGQIAFGLKRGHAAEPGGGDRLARDGEGGALVRVVKAGEDLDE